MEKKEHQFQRIVKLRLKGTKNCWHFTKEALSLRGLPDIVGVCNGRFFAWELKRSRQEANKQVGRILLQRYILELIKKAGGIGEIVHPDNFEEQYKHLIESCKDFPLDDSTLDDTEF